jgi:hypothetical protein
MAGKFGPERKKILNMIEFGFLYLIVQAKIFFIGALSLRKKGVRGLFLLLLGSLLFGTPTGLWAQAPDWPWTIGENLQLTSGLDDNFSPSVASNSSVYFAVWHKKTPTGFDVYGARIGKDGQMVEADRGGILICTAASDKIYPTVSWNGENFFVVWQDRRSGKRWDIYGARVTAFSGFLSVLDPDGIPIAVGRSNYDQVGPSLAFDGKNHLVVWRGKRSASAWNIYCRFLRVTNLEVVSDENVIQVSSSLRDQASPSVIYNPDAGNYFIVWQDKRGGKYWDIYGGRIASDGTSLDPSDILISSHSFNQWDPVISWNGKYYLVAWTASLSGDNWYIYGRMLDTDGNLENYADILFQGDGVSKNSPAIVANEEQSLLIWEEDPAGNSSISGAVIVPGYRIFTGQAKRISDPRETDASFPVLARNGDDLLVVWQAKSPDGYWGIYSRRLLKAGAENKN